MSIKSVMEARAVTGSHQLGAGDMASAVSVPGTGSLVMIQAEAQNVRYRADGVDPTSTVGMVLAAGECHILNVGKGNIQNIKVIQAVAGAILNVTAFR